MEGLMMDGRSQVTACVLLTLVSMVIADSPAAVRPLEAPNMPNEFSVEVLRNASSASSGFSLSPSLDPSKATESYNHNVNTGSVFTYSLNSVTRPETLATPPLKVQNSGEGVGFTRRGSSRQPRQLNSPVPTSHNVSLSWSAISPAPQISQATGSSVPSSLPSVGKDSPYEPPVISPQTQYGTVGVSDSRFPFGDRLEPSSRIQDLQLQPSHDPNTQIGYQPLEPSNVVHHQMTSVSVEPTMGPPEDFFPTNTMDVEYGSGDYLETMSFMGSEGNDYSLVSNLPSDMYDIEDSNSETYDTTFPTRMVMSFSSKHLYPSSIRVTSSFSSKLESSSFNNNSTSNGATTDLTKHTTTFQNFTTFVPLTMSRTPVFTSILTSDLGHTISPSLSTIQPTRIHSLPILPTTSDVLNQNQSVNESSELASDWAGTVTVQPTDVLLPDMNSLEYYTIQLTKDNGSLPEPTANQTASSVFSFLLVGTTHIVSTRTYTTDPSYMPTTLFDEDLQPTGNSFWTEESSTDISGFEPFNNTILDSSELRPSLTDTTVPYLEPSFTQTPSIDPLTSMADINSTTDWATTPFSAYNTSLLVTTPPPVTREPDGMSSVNDSQWIITSLSTENLFPSSVLPTVLVTTSISVSEYPTDSTFNITSTPPATEMADEGFVSGTTSDTMVTDNDNTTPIGSLTTKSSPGLNDTSVTTLSTTPPTTTVRKYLCNITKPDTYLIRVGFPPGSTAGYAKAKVREILKAEYNRSVELQVVKAPPDFVFRAVSGAVVYTAISVINALRISARTTSSFISISPISPVPGPQYHVHTVLQFVPSHVDVRMCTFSEQAEKGLITALAEVRRRSQESTNFTVNILNVTMSSVDSAAQQQKIPVEITFAVRDIRGYVPGTEVSTQLRQLSVVEYSYYLGYPVWQIAEPFHYPELNTTQLLRSSWVRTVLLGVLDQPVSDKIFKATIERRLAQLLSDALGAGRRFRRATRVGNNSVQIVQTTRLVGPDNPLEVIYFVEGANGQRLPAATTANMLNSLDMQHAAIIMGYRIQGILAQPVEKQASPYSDTEKTNTWIIVGVVVPVVVVVIIITILYWKLCRTDKLEFQPDTMSTIQQRQKLQTPSVKGFDFAKLHMGQHSKDDLLVIQEPLPPPVAAKEQSPAENAEVPTPKSKTSSKASRNGQHRRGQISPSEGDSIGSDPPSYRGSPQEGIRPAGLPIDPKQPHKPAINGLNGPPPMNGMDEPLSSASIFEHVDRMSRPTDGPKRPPNKLQLIAMQPMPPLPLASPTANDRAAENAKLNKEIQVALRHKSEIEHHRNKIRLRAKRKGHYDFPAMDDLIDGLGDPKEQDRIYQRAQMQIDKILDPDIHMPSLYTEPKKSNRGKRSPKQRRKQQINGELTDADRDRLITTESDGTYRKYPGVNNIAYVSDPDQGPEYHSPSPSDDVFHGPISPPGHPPPPPPYLPPQPSIEEARQQMHSLLDDAFALVSPTSQGSTAGITLPGVGLNPGPPPASSPPSRGPRPWGPGYLPLNPYTGRYAELGLPPSSVQGLPHRQGLGSGYIPSGEALPVEQLRPESLYVGRGGNTDELPSSTRPRPVGGATGAQLHHLTHAGLTGRVGGGLNWSPYHEDDNKLANNREPVLGSLDYTSISVFQTSRNGLKEPSAAPAHLDSLGLGYAPSAPLEEPSPPNHSSASLIKAIREELMRLSQKQAAVPSYHS
uniref:Si:ch211-1e14.1 n=1 Tax=Cyprinus carpio TaxID=7962 RepID=A0A8C2BG86_CYPCA